MNTKNLMVSLFAVAFVLAMFGTVSATPLTMNEKVYVNQIGVVGTYSSANSSVSVVAGEILEVEIYFEANVDDTDVTVEAELEGNKIKISETTAVFDVINGSNYKKTLMIEVPYELKDELIDTLELNIEIDGKEYDTELPSIVLTVQRPSYNGIIKSVSTPSSIDAGETFPVEIVLKNMGYNDLDDVYVTVALPEVGIFQGPLWFGDLINLESLSSDDDDEDTVAGKFYLEVPYDIEAGAYLLEIVVENDDFESSTVKQIVIGNDFENEVLTIDDKATTTAGEQAEFEILLVNPTNNVKVYKIVSETNSDVSSTAGQTMIAVSAGSSKTVKVFASADSEGIYSFDVNIFSGDELVDTVTYELVVEGNATKTNSTVILTVILAIIFLVLLVVLIVLLAKKPEKTEDFGESYY